VGTKDLNTCWPPLQLTEFEAEYVSHYQTPGEGDHPALPGVYRRAYPLGLQRVRNFPGESDELVAQFVPSGRYTRVFAMTFSGDLNWWKLSLRTNPGEVLFEEALVSSLLNMQANGGSSKIQLTSSFFPPSPLLSGCPLPLLFEPNIVLPGAANLKFEGDILPEWDALLNLLDPPQPDARTRSVLNILVHVWEFPDVLAAKNRIPPRASKPGGSRQGGAGTAAGRGGVRGSK
jgi:hypothetical protein